MADVLLSPGAGPDHGVTLPLAASGDYRPTLELLAAHGADPNQPWATDGAATLFVTLGADPSRPRGDGRKPFAVA